MSSGVRGYQSRGTRVSIPGYDEGIRSGVNAGVYNVPVFALLQGQKNENHVRFSTTWRTNTYLTGGEVRAENAPETGGRETGTAETGAGNTGGFVVNLI